VDQTEIVPDVARGISFPARIILENVSKAKGVTEIDTLLLRPANIIGIDF
jgi:hypothetical protein